MRDLTFQRWGRCLKMCKSKPNRWKKRGAKSGGGLVSVRANGSGEILDISIDDSLLEDKESMQILLISAVNDVLKSVEADKKNTASRMLGGLASMGIK